MLVRRGDGRRRIAVLADSETVPATVVFAGISSVFESRRFVIYGDDYRLIVP